MRSILSFEFVFTLHLMKNILGIINELSIALQKINKDIANAMDLVKVSKQRLQVMRDDLSDQKVEARSIMRSILSFEFVFALHLMKNILGITNELSKKKKFKI